MSRWHERGCTQPDVVVAGGLPCCRFCYGVASLDDVQFDTSLRIRQAPVLEDNSTYNLRWPACVDYVDARPEVPPDASTSSSSGSTFPFGGTQSSQRTNHLLNRPGAPSKESATIEGPQTKRRKLSIADESYRPSRCYPILWGSQEIRMLELDSGDKDSLLHGSFQNVELDSKRARYEALSYTWADSSGDSTRCRPMFIGSYWDIIPITRNCENALRSIRLVGESFRSIWVDSLCINQDDTDERNAQVALMPQIYAAAIGVLAYLGPAADDSERALSAIFNSMSHRNCGHNGKQSQVCADCWMPIKKLLSRPYFRRLWVVQEVVLSKTLTLHCGSKSTPWPFSAMLTPLINNSWITTRDKATVRPLQNLLSLMVDTSECLCKDPRDKVFALLGLASRWYPWPVFPDYRLTVEEVSIGIAAYLTQKCGLGMAVLLFAGANRPRRSTLPSWVPDIQVPFSLQEIGVNLYERFINSGKFKANEYSLSNNVNFDMGSLSLRPLSPCDIRIISRSGYLEVTAIRVCNLRGFFTDDGRYRQSFVRPGHEDGPEMKATLILPIPLRRNISHHIRQDDSLFWLHSINGYALLRSTCASSTYNLLCACDLLFENLDTGKVAKNMSFELFSLVDQKRLEERKECLIETFRLIVGGDHVQSMSELSAEPLLLKLAAYVSRHKTDSKASLWKIWKQLEAKLKPYLEDERGIQLLLCGITGAEPITLGSSQDGRPLQAFLYKGCMLRSSESLLTLLWSLLPKRRQCVNKAADAEKVPLSDEEILKGFQEWADISSDLLFAMSHSIEYEDESFFGIRSSVEMQKYWLKAFNRFEHKIMPQRSNVMGVMEAIAYVLRLFPPMEQNQKYTGPSSYIDEILDSQTKEIAWSHFTRGCLWDWEVVGSNFEKRWKILQHLGQHQWLASWRDGLTDELNGLEQQMLIRYRLNSFGFNLSLPSKITIQ
ncbi:heterokaryon incompatibility protein [Colletotrichum paranaense]|uniref:Heterokaryon incompatibility protein n=1 Tax=Colletotrichum paranaense TaxID=1914294 RepID=A0ABQ9SRP0_9PEZI|nr:heterokaryon incompatibility protein [Colletotrichum paranaense]KAK1542186.1 heterokaryon incompatibility protein [Colletotrichum paranaense]